MKLLDSLNIAIRSLFTNKLRSSLTMLGVIIGVGAVITLMAAGRGAQAFVASTFEKVGTNLLMVTPSSPEATGMAALLPGFSTASLSLNDAKAIADSVDANLVLGVAPASENIAEVTIGGESCSSIVVGVTPEFQYVLNYPVTAGQFISERDVSSRGRVVVLGSEVAEELFGLDDPIGQRVKMKGKRFTVIGILEPKGSMAIMGMSIDRVVMVPITTFQTRLFTQRTTGGEDAVQSIAVKVASAEVVDEVSEEIETILRKRHRIRPDEENDFAIISQEQVMGMFEEITMVFTIFLGAIASISLLVGAIGIMNIMLVSVTERTREIGIRKAVGAKRRDILFQFLTEAAMLSFIGGGIGIIGGWLVSRLVSLIDIGGVNLRTVVSPDIVILAVSVSIFVGLASGIYPALRASRLKPIDALHYG